MRRQPADQSERTYPKGAHETYPLRFVKHIHHLLGTVACRPLKCRRRWSAAKASC